MNIGIIGAGFVGSALYNGIKKTANVFLVDPKLNTNIHDLNEFNPEIVFICVPTPMSDELDQDLSILNEVIDQLKKIDVKPLVVLKSTVLPSHINILESEFKRFVYNPEFLREKSADEDFIESELIVFGGKKSSAKLLSEFYDKYTFCKCNDYIFTDSLTASFIKYTINSFLATKVIFFNELADLYNSYVPNSSWEEFTSALSRDKRIGDSHMQVPGHDGRLGFGGACLPKDTSAFLKFASQQNKAFSILKTVINTNNNIRSEYNNATSRELDQNINFKENK